MASWTVARRPLGLVAATAVAAGAVLLVRAAMPASAETSFRTAVAANGNVEQLALLAGTVQRVPQVAVTFPAGGTVASVSVAVGEQVAQGQTLAALDPTPLQAAVLDAEARVAQDQVALQRAQSATTSAGSVSVGGSAATGGSTARPTTSSAHPATPGDAALTAALTAMRAALTAQQQVCQGVVGPAGGGPTRTSSGPSVPVPHSTTDATTSSPSSSHTSSGTSEDGTGTSTTTHETTNSSSATTSATSTTTSTTADAARLAACASALGTLATSEERAAVAIAAYQQSAGSTKPSGGNSATGAGTTSPGTSGSGSGGSNGTTRASSGSSSAGLTQEALDAQIAAAQAALVTDQQTLTQAQAAVDGATLVAPVAGVVGSVNVTAGGTAGTSSGVIIIGEGAAQVTVQVPLSLRPQVGVGSQALVTPAGGSTPVRGSVSSIALLATSGSSPATYATTVTVPAPATGFLTGGRATVQLVLAEVSNVLTVPASAVTMIGAGRGSVSIVTGDTAATANVTVGAVGQGLAQITGGLTAGDRVVLADYSVPLPANNSQNLRRLTGGGGGNLGGTGGNFGGGAGGGSVGGAGSRS